MKEKTGLTQNRREFLQQLGMAATIPLLSSFPLSAMHQKKNVSNRKDGKLGVALVGLGSYAEGQLAPALLQTEHCYLAGIVTGTPSKIKPWQESYSIEDKNIYNYENFDSIANNKDIDIVYVVLPNSMHAEFVIRAAQAGKHVICEKPMATTVEDCDRMIQACTKAKVQFSIGYRLHFDPYHLALTKLVKENSIGKLKSMSAGFGFSIAPNVWRLDKTLAGGGPLMDLGIYCVQAFCYLSGKEPIAVTAKEGVKTDLKRFKEVEQSIRWTFEMPDGIIAEGNTSYEDGMNFISAKTEKGSFELKSAFSYRGIGGESSLGKLDFKPANQQALQMDDFALCVKQNKPTRVPGEMGKRDVKLLLSIYEAAKTGRRIVL